MPLFVFPPRAWGPFYPFHLPQTTHFAFRPKLIGLRIGWLELFILCPAINQFLRRPNRGRKDRTATKWRKTVCTPRTKRGSNKWESWTMRNKDTDVTTERSVNFRGEIIERAATPFNFIIRSNDAEDTSEKENRRLRALLQLYLELKRERK